MTNKDERLCGKETMNTPNERMDEVRKRLYSGRPTPTDISVLVNIRTRRIGERDEIKSEY